MNNLKPAHHLSFPLKPPPSHPIFTTATFHSQSCNHHHQVLFSYSSMHAHGFSPDPHTFPPLLKACTSLGYLSLGLSIHQHTVVHGYAHDPYISSSLLHMYAKNGDIESARRLFDRMPVRNVVPWSAIIGSYSQVGDADMAFSMFNEMRQQGIQPNSVTMLGLLSGTSRFDRLQCLHGCVVRSGFEMDLVVANSMLNVYSNCGRVELAQRLFDSMPLQDIISWNSMLSGHSRTGDIRASMNLIDKMRLTGIKPDRQTFGSLVSAVTNNGERLLQLGKSVHAQIVRSGYELDAHLETVLISMYLRCGDVNYAFLVFDRTLDRDVVSWTAMISGLVQNDRADRAVSVFHQMLRSGVMPTTTTIASCLAACAQLGLFEVGASIHGYIIRQRMPVDVAAQNSLVTMYAKCGNLKQSQCVFDMIQDKDVVSWNAVVSGHAQNGDLNGAFNIFNRMRLAFQRPDAITVVSLLQACASLGALHHGKWVHSFMIRHGMGQCISIDTSLIDMYSKCGDLKTALKCFNSIPEQDLVSWSAIISGYGNHGMGEAALRIYSDFLHAGMEQNSVIFLSVLSACSHAGLVPQGLRIFQSMKEEFGIVPKLEHCACIIDLLSRAGRVEEALRFVRTVLPQPNADVLGILLDACRVNRNEGLAEVVAKEIIALRPETAGNYVQLAHSYAAMSRWDGVGKTWAQMRTLGLKKAPGWSFIELNGTISTFFADHTSHPQYEEMMLLLKILDREMRKVNQMINA